MRIIGFIWLEEIVEKLAVKHGVTPGEVEQVFESRPDFKRWEKGRYRGEDVYRVLGQTDAQDVLPDDFATIEEFWDFWDTHSSADYEDALEDITVEVDLTSSKVYFPVAKDLMEKLRIQARRQGVSSETLINLWLQERLSQSA